MVYINKQAMRAKVSPVWQAIPNPRFKKIIYQLQKTWIEKFFRAHCKVYSGDNIHVIIDSNCEGFLINQDLNGLDLLNLAFKNLIFNSVH